MIKLAIVISSYEIGGVSLVAKNLLDSLDRNEFEIVFLAEKIQERCYPIPKDVLVVDLNLKPARSIFTKIINLVKHVYNLKKCLASQGPDIIFSLSYNTSCYILLTFPKRMRRKVIIGEYSENFFVKLVERGARQAILRAIYKILMFLSYRRAARIVVVSASIAENLKKFIFLKDAKFKRIPTSVNVALIKRLSKEAIVDYSFQKDIFYVSFLSRLSIEKGIKYLLEAFAKLKEKMQARLIIIGEGALRPDLEARAEKLMISDNVTFLGYRDNPFKYLSNTDLFVLPSLYEGFPSVILEAWACAVPVIATKSVKGIEEIVCDNADGILVNPADSDALYQAMVSSANNSILRESLRKEGLNKVDLFDVNRITKEYQNLFIDVSNNKGIR